MSEENKAIARRWNRIFEGNPSEADAIIAPDCVYHDGPSGIPTGPEGVKAWAQGFRDAFPDLKVSEEEYYAEGDPVVNRFLAGGTHQFPFMNVPASGKRVSITGIQT